METRRQKTVTNRAVRYPLAVLAAGIVLAVATPVFVDTIDPYSFGHAVGRFTCTAFLVALIIGYISDRKHRKIEQKIRRASDS